MEASSQVVSPFLFVSVSNSQSPRALSPDHAAGRHRERCVQPALSRSLGTLPWGCQRAGSSGPGAEPECDRGSLGSTALPRASPRPGACFKNWGPTRSPLARAAQNPAPGRAGLGPGGRGGHGWLGRRLLPGPRAGP